MLSLADPTPLSGMIAAAELQAQGNTNLAAAVLGLSFLPVVGPRMARLVGLLGLASKEGANLAKICPNLAGPLQDILRQQAVAGKPLTLDELAALQKALNDPKVQAALEALVVELGKRRVWIEPSEAQKAAAASKAAEEAARAKLGPPPAVLAGEEWTLLFAANKIPQEEGRITLVCHAGVNHFEVTRKVGGKVETLELTHREIAAFLKSQGWKPGMEVRLVSCNAGGGRLAQDLANSLGVDVMASPDKCWIKDGVVSTGQLQPGGQNWKIFSPKKPDKP